MNIAALIGIMIGIVVGVNLIAPVNSVVNTITTSAGYTQAVVSLTGVLPIIFVTVIILGAVALNHHLGNLRVIVRYKILQTLGSLNKLVATVLQGNQELTYKMNVDYA